MSNDHLILAALARESVVRRFTAKVACGHPAECWPWMASKRGRLGYGQFAISHRVVAVAHRVAWMLHHGKHPGDMVVMHSCDNPPCCNPAHLSLGTPQDNTRDAIRKGRFNFLSIRAHGVARRKLSIEGYANVRDRLAAGEKAPAIAAAHGVAVQDIYNIKYGRSKGIATAN